MIRRILELMIGVDSKPGQRGLDEFQGKVNKFRGNVSKGFKDSFAPLTKVVSGAGLAAAFVGVGRSALDMAEQVQNANKEIGLSTEFIQQWIGVSKKYSIQTEQSIDLLKEFAQRVGEAREEEGELNEMLKRYGVSVRDVNGQYKTHKDLLFEVSELMRNASDEAERLFIADQAFGSGGNGVNRFLADGRENLEKMLDAMGHMDEEMIERLAEAKQTWNEFAHSVVIDSATALDAIRSLFNVKDKFNGGFLFQNSGAMSGRTPAGTFDADPPAPEDAGEGEGEDSEADRKAQARRREQGKIWESRELFMNKLTALEEKLADLKEANRLKEMDTQERIIALDEKRLALLRDNRGETEEDLEKLIEAERIRAELEGLRGREENGGPGFGESERAPGFAVSSLAAVGGGGLIGPSAGGESAALSESRKQTGLLREAAETLKRIERTRGEGGFSLK